MSSLPHSPTNPLPIQSHSPPVSLPHQIEPEVIPEPLDRWHPKITPYRLTIIALGIALGTAKAWMTWRGKTAGSITLEWISGVVISLSLFILGWYDNSDDTSTPISVLFSYDCLDILWRILSIPKPGYRSDERIHVIQSVAVPHHPPITGYRILISAIVTIFGISKMICSYMGLNPAANVIDWVFATIVSTGLYLLGLYEDNPCNILPFLFTTEYSGTVENIFYVALHLTPYVMAPAACAFWLYFWFEPYMRLITTPFALEIPDDARPSSFQPIHNYAFKLMISSILLVPLLFPVLVLFILFRNSRLFPPLRRGLLFIYKKTWLHIESRGSHPVINHAVAFGATCVKIAGKIIFYLLAIAIFAFSGFVSLGSMISRVGVPFNDWDGTSGSFFASMTLLLVLGTVILPFAGFIVFVLWIALVQPLRVYINDRNSA